MDERGEFAEIQAKGARSIAGSVYNTLRDQIVMLVRTPGTQISDKEISHSLGVSRTPVREAMLKLAEEGMIVVRPNTGTYVARIRPSTLANAHFLRLAVECSAIRDIGTASPAETRLLHRIISRQEEEIDASDPRDFYKLDDHFHRHLLDLSRHGEAWSAIDRVKVQLDRVRYLAITKRERKIEVLVQHRAILAAAELGDGATAQERLEEHLRDSFRSIARAVEVYRGYFEEEPSEPSRRG